MTDIQATLAARLLAAIDDRDRHHREAAGDEANQKQMFECGDLNEGYIVSEALAAIDICSAHREIVQYHLVCLADYEAASDRLANHPGWAEGLSQPADLEAEGRVEFARVALSKYYLRILARAYGITEEDG